MADTAQFGHDFLGHLISDTLLQIPQFQRRFAWRDEHVSDFWDDIARARASQNSYFMGTVVLAETGEPNNRRLIIDGQQRITTTAILFVAIRDRLRELGQDRAAGSVEETHLSNYILTQETSAAKLSLSPDDNGVYQNLLAKQYHSSSEDLVSKAYRKLKDQVDSLAPSADDYRSLIDLTSFLDTNVQVLVAVASSLPEAYVIFETLNDRGADLTTADLLKNYLFSNAGDNGIAFAQASWTRMVGSFEKSEDFVKFLRHEYMSRNGRVTHRGLYKALQRDIGNGENGVRGYLERAEKTLSQYTALKEPDDASWSPQIVEVKDSLLAFRRFQFEASTPLLLAAFAKWTHTEATKFVDVVAAWSVRAWAAGTIGGGVSEKAFADAAVAVSSGEATSVPDVRNYMVDLVPDDATFHEAFFSMGSVTTTRAKYLLAQLERQMHVDAGLGVEALPDWSSKSVSVEHIVPKSAGVNEFNSPEEFERFTSIKNRLQNLTLLERSLNNSLDDNDFGEKTETYSQSSFMITRELATRPTWSLSDSATRATRLADLAVKAWPR